MQKPPASARSRPGNKAEKFCRGFDFSNTAHVGLRFPHYSTPRGAREGHLFSPRRSGAFPPLCAGFSLLFGACAGPARGKKNFISLLIIYAPPVVSPGVLWYNILVFLRPLPSGGKRRKTDMKWGRTWTHSTTFLKPPKSIATSIPPRLPTSATSAGWSRSALKIPTASRCWCATILSARSFRTVTRRC